MKRLCMLYIIIITTIIIVSISTAIYNKEQKPLYAWFYFNILISLYEIYIIFVRAQIKSGNCEENFWKEPRKDEIFKEYWNEYACKTDSRYFDKNNYVYFLEGLNVILTLLLGLTLFVKKLEKFQVFVLFFQYINAVFYFTTIRGYNKISVQDNLYRGISSLWLIIPVILIIKKKN